MTDKDLLERLDQYRAARNLDWQDVADLLGVTKQTISNWRAGKSSIRAKSRRGIAVMIAEDQPPAPIQEVRAPARDGSFVPIISSAAAASCSPGIVPLIDSVSEYSEETAYFRQARPGDFAIEVKGSSMSPWYPDGTLLLVRPYQDLRNGQRVVAVLDEGEVVFKIYAAKGKKICLFSIDGEGRDYIFEKPRVPIRYICRVVASQRSEDDLDAEMTSHGIVHDWQLKLNEIPEA